MSSLFPLTDEQKKNLEFEEHVMVEMDAECVCICTITVMHGWARTISHLYTYPHVGIDTTSVYGVALY